MEAYSAEMGCDPTSLVQRDLMSDEASGPEDEDVDEDEWVHRMAVKSGLAIEGEESHVGDYQLQFREHIKPEWRSTEVSLVDNSFKACSPLYFASLPGFMRSSMSSEQELRQKIRKDQAQWS